MNGDAVFSRLDVLEIETPSWGYGNSGTRFHVYPWPDAAVRRHALEQCLECVEIAKQLGSRVVSLWLADGTNYPGQDELRGRHARLLAGLEELYAALSADQQLLIEYKFFEPAFYSTDLPDWGTAALVCRRLGPQAQVLVDTGHHPQGTNVEQIVFMLDQSHNVEGKIDAMIQSVSNVQTAYAKALLVDQERLADAQRAGDVLG